MKNTILIFAIFFTLRLVSLAISIRNEKIIRKKGGVQYGKLNSICLTLMHVLFYFICLYEAIHKNHLSIDSTISKIGLGMLVFAYCMLFYVIYQLKEIWTLKIYILPDHKINTSFLFRWIRHPNYFLNIIPELVGMALFCRAYVTFGMVFPIYMMFLTIRIIQEERVMKDLYKQVRNF